MGEPKKLTRKPTLTSSEEAEFAALYEPPAKQPKLANPFPQSSEDAWKRKLPESRYGSMYIVDVNFYFMLGCIEVSCVS